MVFRSYCFLIWDCQQGWQLTVTVTWPLLQQELPYHHDRLLNSCLMIDGHCPFTLDANKSALKESLQLLLLICYSDPFFCFQNWKTQIKKKSVYLICNFIIILYYNSARITMYVFFPNSACGMWHKEPLSLVKLFAVKFVYRKEK